MELIVSMAIIAIISAIVLPNYREAGRDLFLREEANRIAQYIEEVRAFSIAAAAVQMDNMAGVERTAGRRYAIKIEEDSYETFAVTAVIMDNDDREIRVSPLGEFFLERNVRVFEIVNDEGIEFGTGDKAVIAFSPPDPVVYFYREKGHLEDDMEEGENNHAIEVSGIQIKVGYGHKEEEIKVIVGDTGIIYTERID